MRKRTKKLALHRETLRSLVTEDLRRVVGGATHEFITTCACTDGCGTGGCSTAGCTGGGCGTGGTETREFITTCVC